MDTEELRILLRTQAETAGATQTRDALRQVRQAADQHTTATTAAARSHVLLGASFSTSNVQALKLAGSLVGVSSATALVTASAAVAAVAIGGAIQTGIEFGAAMAGVGAVSGSSAAQLAKLSDLARKSGKDLGIGGIEGAKGLQELVKGGVSAEAALGGALRATEVLAKAGGVDLATAAEISATALNSFGLNAAQLAHVADMVAGAANASSIGVDDFRQSLSQAGAVARTIGVTFDDTAVAIAELGQAGIKGSDAGTSLRTFLLSLSGTSVQATDELRRLGIITAEGGNKFFDASGRAKNLADVSQILKTSLAGQTDQQRLATLQIIFGTDALRAASIFSREGADGFDKLAAAMAKISANDVAAAQLDSLSGDLGKLKQAADDAAISLEKVFDPALRAGVRALTEELNRDPGALARQALLNIPHPAAQALGAGLAAQNALAPKPETVIPSIGEVLRLTERHAQRVAEIGANIAALERALTPATAAAVQFGATFRIVDETLQHTHRDLAQVAKDIGDLSGRSGALAAIFGALSPSDTGTRAEIAALQDLQKIDAAINAQRAAAAIAQEQAREREATKITDPRDAPGANAARQRLEVLDKLIPAERARAEAEKAQADAQKQVSALEVLAQQRQLAVAQPLADLRTETLLRETQIAEVQQRQVDLADRITLASRQNLDLVQQTAQARLDALPSGEALSDNNFESQQLKLENKAIRADVRRGALPQSAIEQILPNRQRITELRREAPRLESDAFNAARPGELLERQATRQQLTQTITLAILEEQKRSLDDQLTSIRHAQALTDARTAAIQRQLELQTLAETNARTAAQQQLLSTGQAVTAAEALVQKSIEWAANIGAGLQNITRAAQELSTMPMPTAPPPAAPPTGPQPYTLSSLPTDLPMAVLPAPLVPGVPPGGFVNPDRQRAGAGGASAASANTTTIGTVNITFTGPVSDPQAIADQVLAALHREVDSAPRANSVGLAGAI